MKGLFLCDFNRYTILCMRECYSQLVQISSGFTACLLHQKALLEQNSPSLRLCALLKKVLKIQGGEGIFVGSWFGDVGAHVFQAFVRRVLMEEGGEVISSAGARKVAEMIVFRGSHEKNNEAWM